MDYMNEAEYMVSKYLKENNISKSLFSSEQISEIVQKCYKNYYGYELDEEYALRDAVSEVICKYDLNIPGYEVVVL